ncbi:MAG: type IV secretion system protein VirB4, partial [Desulfobulbus sp.]|nr:type IV secretion system protein VirB4 [Desulfobulbus sp.]
DIVTNATPKRDYYIISPEGRRLVQLALGTQTLSFVGAADKESITRIRQLAAEHGPNNWQPIWLQERGN